MNGDINLIWTSGVRISFGRAYVETDEAEADEATIIENILSGQYSHPLRVIAFNTSEGWSRDVTEDIAVAVLNRGDSEHRSIGKAAQEVLGRALGETAQTHYHFQRRAD